MIYSQINKYSDDLRCNGLNVIWINNKDGLNLSIEINDELCKTR
jgi:hypothetical protein